MLIAKNASKCKMSILRNASKCRMLIASNASKCRMFEFNPWNLENIGGLLLF
jgi:hypothetical protein